MIWHTIADLLAGVVLGFITLGISQGIWNQPPNDSRVVNWLAVLLGLAIIGAAVYQAGLHW